MGQQANKAFSGNRDMQRALQPDVFSHNIMKELNPAFLDCLIIGRTKDSFVNK